MQEIPTYMYMYITYSVANIYALMLTISSLYPSLFVIPKEMHSVNVYDCNHITTWSKHMNVSGIATCVILCA